MKLIKILIISLCIIFTLSQNIFAIGEILSTAESWMNTGEQKAGIGMDTSQLREGSTNIYNLLLAVATVVAVLVGAILGIKYMVSGIEEKAQVKESLIPYFVSCIIVFGSMGIWKLAVVMFGEIV